MSREQRRLFLVEESSAEPGQFGCPMLARVRQTSLVEGQAWRCALAWSLHESGDVAKCQATESVSECWKSHPERRPVANFPPVAVIAKASAD